MLRSDHQAYHPLSFMCTWPLPPCSFHTRPGPWSSPVPAVAPGPTLLPLAAVSAARNASGLSTPVPPSTTRWPGFFSLYSTTALASSYVLPPRMNTMIWRK